MKKINPFREWIREASRSEEDRLMYKRIVREIAAIIAGKRPMSLTSKSARRSAYGSSRTSRCKTAGDQ
jgi:hypothetical protein